VGGGGPCFAAKFDLNWGGLGDQAKEAKEALLWYVSGLKLLVRQAEKIMEKSGFVRDNLLRIRRPCSENLSYIFNP